MPTPQQSFAAINWPAVIESIDDAVIAVDAEQRIMYWNHAAAVIYGWSSAEAIGRTIDELIPVLQYRDGSSPEAVLADVLRAGVWRGEVIQRRRDGAELWIDASVRVIFDDDDRPNGMVGINRDRTAQVRAEQSRSAADHKTAELLRRQVHRLGLLADLSHAFAATPADLQTTLALMVERVGAAIGDACVVRLLSADGTALLPSACAHIDPAANDLTRRIFYAASTSIDQGLSGIAARTGASFLRTHLDRAGFLSVARTSYELYYDYSPIHSVIVVPLQVERRVLGVLGVFRDKTPEPYASDDLMLVQEMADRAALALENTRLRAAEYQGAERLKHAMAQLDALFDSTPLGLAFIDAELRFLRVNRRMAELNGASPEAHIGRPLADVIPTYAPLVEPLYRRILAGEGVIENLEFHDAHAEPPRDWLTSYFPVSLAAGPIIGVGVVFVEITARRQAERAMHSTAAQLRALSHRMVEVQENERRHLARELHDEIGQTLTGLDIMLEMLARHHSAPIPETLDMARRYVRELSERVRRLSLDLRPSMLDDLGLNPTLRWLFDRFTSQTGIEVRFHQHGAERRFAPVIETAAYRIIQEALTNVARHAQINRVVVQLMTDRHDLQIQIEDEGIGFDLQTLQSDHYQSGLAGMRERVELLGGQIAIESAPQRGTLILVDLPMYPVTTTIPVGEQL
ncbi:MAG: PAS domain-containing protein [Oscillochloris sp.]|nr:PAS domain-containing protein [Oscillochloris sp.]